MNLEMDPRLSLAQVLGAIKYRYSQKQHLPGCNPLLIEYTMRSNWKQSLTLVALGQYLGNIGGNRPIWSHTVIQMDLEF